ncbi:hypothetical protein LG314_12360 [Agrococcus terreus]|uniref:hypothetical protein n=1 Tax=Agrococcus terreus TaxID=574649 RepID=UPI00384B82DC
MTTIMPFILIFVDASRQTPHRQTSMRGGMMDADTICAELGCPAELADDSCC